MAEQGNGNILGRLSDYALAELERVMNLDMDDDEAVRLELARAKSVETLVKAQRDVAATMLDATRLRAEFMGSSKVHVPRELLG